MAGSDVFMCCSASCVKEKERVWTFMRACMQLGVNNKSGHQIKATASSLKSAETGELDPLIHCCCYWRVLSSALS